MSLPAVILFCDGTATWPGVQIKAKCNSLFSFFFFYLGTRYLGDVTQRVQPSVRPLQSGVCSAGTGKGSVFQFVRSRKKIVARNIWNISLSFLRGSLTIPFHQNALFIRSCSIDTLQLVTARNCPTRDDLADSVLAVLSKMRILNEAFSCLSEVLTCV